MSTVAEQQALVNLSYQASAAIWPLTAISTVLFGMRVFARVHTPKATVGWEDVIISVAWILDICKSAFFQKALYSAEHIRFDDFIRTMAETGFWTIFTDSWVFLSITVPKLSIGLLIIQIFRPQRWLKRTILSLCIALNILALIGSILNFVQCDPVPGQWNPAAHPGRRCWDRKIIVYYACIGGGISAFMDLAFAVYPGIVVWHLQMSIWKKISTTALMGLGLASFAFAVIKIYFNTALLQQTDATRMIYNGIRVGMWNSIENDFVLSAACLPFAPPFFRACKTYMATMVRSSDHESSPKQPDSPKDFGRFNEKDTDESTQQASDENLVGSIATKEGATQWFDRKIYSSTLSEHTFV